jgi:hypothetical protein
MTGVLDDVIPGNSSAWGDSGAQSSGGAWGGGTWGSGTWGSGAWGGGVGYPELWGGGGRRHMGIIFTNSHADSNKFCSLCVRLMFLQSLSVQRGD